MKILISHILLLGICVLSCTDYPKPVAETSGFADMRDSITRIFSEMDPLLCTYENERRVKLFEEKFTRDQSAQALVSFIRECLNSGLVDKAIESMKWLIEQNRERLGPINSQSKVYHEILGICYLRKAELENCVHNHNGESCIVPVKGGGIHLDMSGSELAIGKYLEILNVFPDDFQSRWLLNLAYMTLDRYPQDVPGEYLIELPEQQTELTISNIATKIGVDVNGLSGGVMADDFNNDGLLDIVASSWGSEGRMTYFQNSGNRGFADLTEESGLVQAQGGLNLKQADYNNDGFLDFIILRGAWRPNESWGIAPNSLIKNNGDGTFSDVTIKAGLYSINPTQSAEWFDFDNDGWIDLFIANETTNSSQRPFPCELYRNNGDGTFTDVAGRFGVNFRGYFKGVTSGDVNNDGWPDLYISNLSGDNILLLNVNDSGLFQSFARISTSAGVSKPFAAFPCWFFDYDNDGWEDIYVASFDKTAFTDQSGQFARDMLGHPVSAESNALYKNMRNNRFDNLTETCFESRVLHTMGCNYGDIDNDGFPDFYLGTGAPDFRSVVPNRFFLNENGIAFADHTFSLGLGHIQKGHGIAFADFDNDGDQDIYAVMGGAYTGDRFPNAFFENGGTPNNWIKLKLSGGSANKAAIGAKVKITGIAEQGSELTFYKTVNSGASFGANPLLLEMGLGDMVEITSLEIKWPNGRNEFVAYDEIEINKKYLIVENKQPVEMELHTFEFNKSEVHKHHH